jgi:hypothetical protein
MEMTKDERAVVRGAVASIRERIATAQGYIDEARDADVSDLVLWMRRERRALAGLLALL